MLKRATAKLPGERHLTACALVDDLRRALQDERQQLRAAAQYWADRDHAAGLLWGGDMSDVLRFWQRHASALSELELAFVTASLRAVRKLRMRRRMLALGAIALVLGVGLYMNAQRVKAVEIEGEQQEGRSALIHGDPDAIVHLSRAYERGDREPKTEFMYARSAEPRLAVQARLDSFRGRVWTAIVSPDGRQLVTVDEAGAHIWDAQSYQPLRTLPHAALLVHATFTANGSQIVTAGGASVRIWNANDGTLIRELAPPIVPPRNYLMAAATPDGQLVAAIDWDTTVVYVWDAATGELLRALNIAGTGTSCSPSAQTAAGSSSLKRTMYASTTWLLGSSEHYPSRTFEA